MARRISKQPTVRKSGVTEPMTFVLVHGAWGGGWSVERLAGRLRAKVHRVYAPTLSGLGERSHLVAERIDLCTHINDVVNEILWKDLRQVKLVGISYGGLVITGVAERIKDRIDSIVYVDAFIPRNGQSFADITGVKLKGKTTAPMAAPRSAFPTKADWAWVRAKSTPQPNGTFKERLRVTGAYLRVRHRTYVQATGWDGPFFQLVANLRRHSGWKIHEINCAHDIANLRPDELTGILVRNP